MKRIALLLGLLSPAFVQAQPAHGQHDPHSAPLHQADAQMQPRTHAHYAGLQNRTIKALSDEQISDLRAGKGMSYALAAELNGYPGPAHVLDMAGALGLTHEQEQATAKLKNEMTAEAIGLGEQLIAAEMALDRLFKEKTADIEQVSLASQEAARVQAMLRAAHLCYHLRMAQLLTAAQIDKYRQLRGYR